MIRRNRANKIYLILLSLTKFDSLFIIMFLENITDLIFQLKFFREYNTVQSLVRGMVEQEAAESWRGKIL